MSGNPLKSLILLLIRFYQLGISPLLPGCCRFTPTCSEYTRQAVVRFGIGRGLWLGLRRLSKCHPLHAGGYDPVPPGSTETKHAEKKEKTRKT